MLAQGETGEAAFDGRTEKAKPPAATRRIASTSSGSGAVLSTNPAAPKRRAASAY